MKALSDRLLEAAEWEIHMPIELREWLEEAAALAKSVESAPVVTVDPMPATNSGFGVIVIGRELVGQRIALVPLPQQSETPTPPTGGG